MLFALPFGLMQIAFCFLISKPIIIKARD